MILADEMGLGKSVQAISLLWILLKQLKQKGATSMKFILIAPTSLIGNWRCEFNKWLPHSEQLVGSLFIRLRGVLLVDLSLSFAFFFFHFSQI